MIAGFEKNELKVFTIFFIFRLTLRQNIFSTLVQNISAVPPRAILTGWSEATIGEPVVLEQPLEMHAVARPNILNRM